MPPKRRTAKRKAAYPEVLQKLIDGAPIKPSAEASEELIDLGYFGWATYPELPREVFAKALKIAWGWDDEGLLSQ
jgi:hypothetical protein